MGLDLDLLVMFVVVEILDLFGILYELMVVFVYRILERMVLYVQIVYKCGVKVIIVGVGGVVYFFGMVVFLILFFVIGVFVKGSYIDGLDLLLFIVQML